MGAAITSVDAGHGVQLETVVTDDLVLTFLPQFGGRLISIQSAGQEFLWRNARLLDGTLRACLPLTSWRRTGRSLSEWENPGGSKTWPAPQGWQSADQWAGPPDPVLDSGSWAFHASSHGDVAIVTMSSPVDPRTNLRVVREFTVPPVGHSFSQRTSFTNVGAAPVRWSIWEVCQVPLGDERSGDAAAYVDVSSAAPHAHVDLGSYVGSISPTSVTDDILRVALSQVVAKRGFPSSTGHLLYRSATGKSIAMSSDVVAGADYPDGGCPAEIWMQYPSGAPIDALAGFEPVDSYAELELLSPLHEIAPEATVSSALAWTVHPDPAVSFA